MAIADVLYGVAVIEVTTESGPETIGYTTDGCTLTISTETADIKVEELSGTIHRVITDQQAKLTLNMAEATLVNMAMAIPGSELNSNKITLGGQALQEVSISMEVPAPTGMSTRTLTLSLANPTGEVAMSYRKGEATVVPVTWSVLIDDDGEWGAIEDTA